MGFNTDHTQKRRHYRKYFNDELENTGVFIDPFNEYPIMRGQSRGASKSWFSRNKTDASGQVSTIKQVGLFKGLIRVLAKNQQDAYQEMRDSRLRIIERTLHDLHKALYGIEMKFKREDLQTQEGIARFRKLMRDLGADGLGITKHFQLIDNYTRLSRMLMKSTKCTVRLYMISGYDFSSRDNGSHSDPYLRIKLGKKVFDE